jgi:hypothetical protein
VRQRERGNGTVGKAQGALPRQNSAKIDDKVCGASGLELNSPTAVFQLGRRDIREGSGGSYRRFGGHS